jgi:hypothetical protein
MPVKIIKEGGSILIPRDTITGERGNGGLYFCLLLSVYEPSNYFFVIQVNLIIC